MNEADANYESFRKTAAEAAALGGQEMLRRLGQATVQRKRDQSPVTDADHAVQAMILEFIARKHPDHAVLVEETLANAAPHADRRTAEYCWVIDPIDGTRNFSRGLRLIATSVALLRRGSPVAGAIFDGCTGEVYSASLAGGAFAGSRRLRLEDRPCDGDTTVAVSSFRLKPVPPGVKDLLHHKFLLRNTGSACTHFVWAAAGFVDALFAPDTKLWDIAAGSLIVAEAGGVVTDMLGRPRWPVDVNDPDETVRDIAAGRASIQRMLVEAARQH